MARSGWVPNQHGAWAMLAVPAVVGATLLVRDAGWHAAVAPVLAGWFVGYFAFHATSLWLKSRRKPRYRTPVLVYGAATAALAVAALALAPRLAVWALAFVPLLAVALAEAARRRDRSMTSGAVTVVAACLLVPVLATLGAGPRAVVAPWAACTCYFLGTVLVVKTMIRERGSRGWLAASIAWHVACAAAFWDHPALAAFFAVGAARAAALPRLAARGRRITPMQVGLVEIVLSVALAVVLLA